MRRRTFLSLPAAALFAAACGSDDNNAPSNGAGGAAATTGPSGTSPSAAQSRGELKLAVDFLPTNLDPTKTANILRFGIGETLTRQNPDLKIEPWLAESVTTSDSSTWRVTLRSNVRFHDGSPMDAEAVAASFRRAWENQPAASGLINRATEVAVVNPTTLDFKLPEPDGAFPNNLTAFQFIVHKPSGDAATMTGPYKATRLVPDESLQLEATPDYWGGPPPIARLSARLVRDANARVLALQSGDADLLTGLPFEMVDGLPNSFERPVITGLRVQHMLLNHARPPFNDRAVREAFALAIDREPLNKVGFNGQGKATSALFPPISGFDAVSGRATDVNRARQILDGAGWTPGSDGIRAKDGRRLAITLLSYPQRADLTPMAISIQSQLKPLGIDIKVEQVQDATKAIEGGDFDATMYSINMLPTGDPLYAINQTLARDGIYNYGKYTNPRLDAAISRLRAESNPAQRQIVSRQIQEIVAEDIANIYLVASPLAFAYNKSKVKSLTLHPNDLYLVDMKLAVQ